MLQQPKIPPVGESANTEMMRGIRKNNKKLKSHTHTQTSGRAREIRCIFTGGTATVIIGLQRIPSIRWRGQKQ